MFRNLKLDRNLIKPSIEKYGKEKGYSNIKISEERKPNHLTRYHINLDEKTFYLDFYFKSNGDTTISINNGPPAFRKEREEIAKFIKNYCKTAEEYENNRNMTFDYISINDFNAIINIITTPELEYCSKNEEICNDEKEIRWQFWGKNSDKVTVRYFKNTNTVLIQGKPLVLFNTISSYFNEVTDEDKIVENLEKNYQLNLTKENIEEQYKCLLPNSWDKHSDKLKKSLLRAVYNLNITSQEYTCTELVFEALRALEGHIKITLSQNNIYPSPKNKHGNLEMFGFNEKKREAYIKKNFQDVFNEKIKNIQKIEYYKKAYYYIWIYRHKIFHWDYPDETSGLDQTIQLETTEEARKIILDVLELIDEYYTI